MPRFQSIDEEDSIHARSRAAPVLPAKGGGEEKEWGKLERRSADRGRSEGVVRPWKAQREPGGYPEGRF